MNFFNNDDDCNVRVRYCFGPTGPRGATGPTGPAGGPTGATARLFKSSNKIIIDSN